MDSTSPPSELRKNDNAYAIRIKPLTPDACRVYNAVSCRPPRKHSTNFSCHVLVQEMKEGHPLQRIGIRQAPLRNGRQVILTCYSLTIVATSSPIFLQTLVLIRPRFRKGKAIGPPLQDPTACMCSRLRLCTEIIVCTSKVANSIVLASPSNFIAWVSSTPSWARVIALRVCYPRRCCSSPFRGQRLPRPPR